MNKETTAGGVVEISVKSPDELKIVLDNIRLSMERMQNRIDEQEPEIKKLIIALMSTGQWKDANRALNHQIDILSTESEALIDLPDANSPEIKVRRKIVADKINELLDVQQQINSQIKSVEAAEADINSASGEDLRSAQEVVDEIFKNAHSVSQSPSGLN